MLSFHKIMYVDYGVTMVTITLVQDTFRSSTAIRLHLSVCRCIHNHPSKHGTLTKYYCNAGPTSATVGNIKPTLGLVFAVIITIAFYKPLTTQMDKSWTKHYNVFCLRFHRSYRAKYKFCTCLKLNIIVPLTCLWPCQIIYNRLFTIFARKPGYCRGTDTVRTALQHNYANLKAVRSSLFIAPLCRVLLFPWLPYVRVEDRKT